MINKLISADVTSENRLIKKLLAEHFDGVVIIDAKSGIVAETQEYLTGNLKKYVAFNMSYEEQMEKIVDEKIYELNQESLKNLLSLSVIKERLSEGETYNVDFHTMSDANHNCRYKRISFEYLDDGKNYVLLVCEDVSGIISNERDPLTGLYNSTGFHNHVREWIAANPGKKYRIQRYDVDRFKDINGVYGYAAGNRLLRNFGYQMNRFNSKDSFAAHLNADHFVRFCSEDAMTVEECYNNFVSSFAGYELTIPISIHMGVYDLCESECDSFNMSYKALLALQSVKGNLSKPIAYYEKGMMDEEIEHQRILSELDRAVANGEFEIWFQPQMDYEKKNLSGAEALVRWRHPEKGLIPPGDFIPLLERSDCISKVDIYVIEKTCEFMQRQMKKRPEKPVFVSVNLSRNDLYHKDFINRLEDIVKKYDSPSEYLRLEIIESAYMDNPELLTDAVKRLKGSGFTIEMDDFGSGYSSLNILKDIDIDILKLDMKFLSESKNEKRSEIIIASVINMASALGLPVIAEGVETMKQADMLRGFGCKFMQGFYFSKPVPECEYEEMLEKMQQ